MTRLQHIPSLLHWFTQVAYWTLLIANMHHSSFKNSNTHNSLWLLRSKWTHQSIYVKWNPVSHSKYSSVTTIFPYNLPPLNHKGSLSLWTSFGNTCIHFLTLLYQIPSVLRHKAVHIFFSHCTEGQKSKLKVWAAVFLLEASENAPIPFSASRDWLPWLMALFWQLSISFFYAHISYCWLTASVSLL